MHCPSHKNRILLNHGKSWGSMSVFNFLPEVITFHDISISQTFILEDTMTAEANDVNDHVLLGCLRNIALRDFLIGTYFEVLDFI